MSKMGKFLAAKKGKASVKASADTALQKVLEAEVAADQKMLEAIQATKIVKIEADDWGVEESDEGDTVGGITGSGVLSGSHFHLISEEDVSNKKPNRASKKWGEPSNIIEDNKALTTTVSQDEPVKEQPQQSSQQDEQDTSFPAVTSTAVQEEKKAPITTTPTKYVAPKGKTLHHHHHHPKVNIQDNFAFPALGLEIETEKTTDSATAAETTTASEIFSNNKSIPSIGNQEKKKDRRSKGEQKNEFVSGIDHINSNDRRTDELESPSISSHDSTKNFKESSNSGATASAAPITVRSSPVVMSIEQFLSGIFVQESNVGFSDNKTRQKFVGRRKRPMINVADL